MPLWSQIVLGVAVATLLACTCFILYVRKREKKGEPLWTNLDDVVVYPEGSVKKMSSRAPVSPTPAGTSPAQSNTPRGNDLELPQRSAN